jgi:hypothetical protein
LNGTLCSSKLMLAVCELLECCEVLFSTIRLLFLWYKAPSIQNQTDKKWCYY